MRRTGLYPGTFDPCHNGHIDVIKRAAKLVDTLVVGVAVNAGKGPLFSIDERVAILEHECRDIPGDIIVRPYAGLTVAVARELGAQILVRGLRAFSDFEFEFQITAMNQQMDREIETVFLMTDPRHQALASRLVKEIAMLGGDVSNLVSPYVRERLLEKVALAR